METPTLPGAGTPPPLPPTGVPSTLAVLTAPHAYSRDCACARCAGQRQKWRDKDKARKLRIPGAAMQSAPVPGASLAPAPGVQSNFVALPVAPPPVPWTPDLIAPLLREAVTLCERGDVSTLAKKALEISPACAELVRTEGGWPEAGKAAVVSGGSKTVAKYLNKFGVSAEYAPEIELGAGLLAILASRHALMGKLDEMAKAAKAERERAATAKAA